MRCQDCQKRIDNILGDYKFSNWLKLMNYFEHEKTEGEITEATYEEMIQSLMSFKPSIEIKRVNK